MKLKVKKRDRWWKVYCQQCQVGWQFNAWLPSRYRRSPGSDMGAYRAILVHLDRHAREIRRVNNRRRNRHLKAI